MAGENLFDVVKRVFRGVEVRIPERERSLALTPEVLEGLPERGREGLPHPDACRCCGGRRFWRLRATVRRSAGPWVCPRCHPPLVDPGEIETWEGTP